MEGACLKILSAIVENFGSYEKLEFDFTNKGLTLISGPTGAGKSTLCDVVPWVLFGVTAKNGAVDEIRSWNATEPTAGRINVEVNGSTYWVHRVRGLQRNDLYFIKDLCWECPQRGKDLADTQALINEELGLSSETYLAAAYFHEFSQTASFFTTTAKVRRQITEQLVDLSLPKKLTEALSEYRKELKTEYGELTKNLLIVKERVDSTSRLLDSTNKQADDWDYAVAEKKKVLQVKSANFEDEKLRAIDALNRAYIKETVTLQSDILDLEREIKADSYYTTTRAALEHQIEILGDTRCGACGALKNTDQRMIYTKQVYVLDAEKAGNDLKRINLKRWTAQLEKVLISLGPKIAVEEGRTNTYEEQVAALEREENPHYASLIRLDEDLKGYSVGYESLTAKIDDITTDLEDLDILSQVSDDLRGACIARAVSFLEAHTDELLSSHFEDEIRVEFNVADSDKLDVIIYKDGNTCTYSQLSKGQRQLLKLTFGVAVMKSVANNSGVTPSCIMLDEPTDGCDESLKLKSFGLLEKLATEYETVLIVDHNEALKSMFTNRYEVSLINGKSQVESA